MTYVEINGRRRMTRPDPLTITNLIARKISECCQVLRWDNDQYERLCGYRVALSEGKNSPVLWHAEWPADHFPRDAEHHYLLVWIEGLDLHSKIVLSVSAHSSDRHGAPRAIHLAGWYETETYVGPAAQHDPNAPVLLVSNPARPEIPGINIFEHDGTLRMRENCSVEELHGSKYSRVRELGNRGLIEVPSEYVRKRTISGHRLPMSYPARVDEMVLAVPRNNPAIEISITPASQ